MTDEPEKRECKYCDKLISGNINNFKAHLFTHNAIEPRFTCNVCSRPYFRRDTYIRHMNHHFENGETTAVQFKMNSKKVFICDFCDRSFRDKRNLVNHLKIHDDGYYRIARTYKCHACLITYCEERLLKNHIRKEHFNLIWQEKSYDLKKVNETWIEPILDSKRCVEITKVTNNVIRIKKSNIKSEPTDDLKKYFIDYKDIMHYSKVICDYCKKEMLKKSLIKHIKERHLKIRKFSCEVCKRSFSRHYQLVDHVCGLVRKNRGKRSLVLLSQAS